MQHVHEVLGKVIWVIGFRDDRSVSPKIQQHASRIVWLEDVLTLASGQSASNSDSCHTSQRTNGRSDISSGGARGCRSGGAASSSTRRAQAGRLHPKLTLQAGQALMGTVTSVTGFGAFVDVGWERDGLVHISNMRYCTPHCNISMPRTLQFQLCYSYCCCYHYHYYYYYHYYYHYYYCYYYFYDYYYYCCCFRVIIIIIIIVSIMIVMIISIIIFVTIVIMNIIYQYVILIIIMNVIIMNVIIKVRVLPKTSK